MSDSTWNFPTYQCMDNLSLNASVRATGGNIFKVGPGEVFHSPSTTQPFTTQITGIFSFLVRAGWTNQNNATDIQGIFSLGKNGGTAAALYIYLGEASTTPYIRITFWDELAGVTRYDIKLRDEDGSSNIKDDKWYQMGIAATSSGMTYAVNGNDSPNVTVLTNSPGSLELDKANARVWCAGGPSAAWGTNLPSQITSPVWSSLLLGPSCWSTQVLDFSSSTVRDRIWDSEGNFKNPGEDGSLWFGDTYAGNTPNYYFVDGSPIIQNGSDTQEFDNESGIAHPGVNAGLRKQYE